MINKDLTINEIISTYPETVDVFASKGLRGLDNKLILKKVGNYTLAQILDKKGIDVNAFIGLLEDATADITSADVTLKDMSNQNSNLKVIGLLPCPVRIPILEEINKHQISDFDFELQAASMGLDHLKEEILSATNESELASVYISAGFDLFFDGRLIERFTSKGTFKDLSNIEFNKDFENDNISLRDPNGNYSMISVVPAVFLVNKNHLDGKPIPKTWADILDPMYKGMLSLPVSDFDLFNAILIHIHKEYGIDGVSKLRDNLAASLHPAQMVKAEKGVVPAISIMPYFFTRMAAPGSPLVAVWPEDGAIVSPIFMLTKASQEKEIQPVSDIMMSKQMGEILSHQGLFPSVSNEVDNQLDGKPFKFVGWDYINKHDIGAIIEECMTEFNKGV